MARCGEERQGASSSDAMHLRQRQEGTQVRALSVAQTGYGRVGRANAGRGQAGRGEAGRGKAGAVYSIGTVRGGLRDDVAPIRFRQA